jgi:hypothetical protein
MGGLAPATSWPTPATPTATPAPGPSRSATPARSWSRTCTPPTADPHQPRHRSAAITPAPPIPRPSPAHPRSPRPQHGRHNPLPGTAAAARQPALNPAPAGNTPGTHANARPKREDKAQVKREDLTGGQGQDRTADLPLFSSKDDRPHVSVWSRSPDPGRHTAAGGLPRTYVNETGTETRERSSECPGNAALRLLPRAGRLSPSHCGAGRQQHA